MGTWAPGDDGGPMIWVDHVAGRYRLTLNKGTVGDYLDAGQSPAVGQWQHVAATYDGAVARFFLDGVQTASKPFTGNVGNSNAWRLGAYGASPAGFFDGAIDEVRIYDRALSVEEIQADMATGVAPPDHQAPSQPDSFTTLGRTTSTITTSWEPSTDNVRVSGYRVYRNGSLAVVTTATEYTLDGLNCATSYQIAVEAYDSSGNTSRALDPERVDDRLRHDAPDRLGLPAGVAAPRSRTRSRSSPRRATPEGYGTCASRSTARRSAPRSRASRSRSSGTRAPSRTAST